MCNQGQGMKLADHLGKEILETGVDNWADRKSGMVCASCVYFVEKRSNQPQPADKLIGRCRRHAPTMNGFPVVYSSDWCGDHKVDENK